LARPPWATWLGRASNVAVRSAGTALLCGWRPVRFLLLLATGTLVTVAAALVGSAWVLSQGPMGGAWLADRLNPVLHAVDLPVRVSFTHVTLGWPVFRDGAGTPLELRADGIGVAGLDGRPLLEARSATLRFALSDLLLGSAVPREIEADGIRAYPDKGAMALAGGDQAAPGRKAEPFAVPAHLRRLRLADVAVAFGDTLPVPGLRADGAALSVERDAGGRLKGTLRAPLAVGAETSLLTADLDVSADGAGTLGAAIGPFRLSLVPLLAGAELTAAASAQVALGQGLSPVRGRLTGRIGAGSVRAGRGSAQVLGGTFDVSAEPGRVELAGLHLDLKRAADGAMQTADLTGSASLSADRVRADVTASVGRIAIPDLAVLWPEGVGGGARGWIVEHVTAGGVPRGSVSLTLEADSGFRDVVLTRAAGELDVSGASFTWIDHVPPVEQADARIRLLDPDAMEVSIAQGRQRIRPGHPDLVVSNGLMRITGLSEHDQFADIRFNAAGPVTSVMALLAEPRLKLLSAHPIGLKPSAGNASAELTFRLPLEDKVKMDDVAIRAEAKLSQVRLPNAVRNLDLEGGAFDLSADKDGLRFKGRGALAGVPLDLSGEMDFRSGTPDQVVQKIVAKGSADAARLVAAGLPADGTLSGPVGLTADFSQKRSGEGRVALAADLQGAVLEFAPLAWRKAAGAAAGASAELVLVRDQLVRIERIRARGDGLELAGSALFPPGRAASVTLDSLVLGRTEARASVGLAPLAVTVRGPRIDLGPKLTETGGDGEPATKPAWSVDAWFEEALLANGEVARELAVRATGTGAKVVLLDAKGSLGGGAGFNARIAADAGGRKLTVASADAGALLRGLDVTAAMTGGRLEMSGAFGAASGMAPVSGTLTIEGGIVRNSPTLAKLLQAITVYGLVDALRGPGLRFDSTVVPYRYDGRNFFLDGAVASSPSLGVTASGRIAAREGASSSLTGTVVPAYFFNSLPGQLPLIGRLFSAEKGGGLFAVSFSLDGPISTADVSINPVSALTPGFMRDFFGLFGKAAQ